MSGFDVAELMPFYLDESDEQIVSLGDLLLQLERTPDDANALREAFRLIHTIKGASTVMGFDQVKGLTHHLETFFDRLRGGERALDRPSLDLFFRCLDALRDYHADLRAKGRSEVDLSGLTALVVDRLGRPAEDVGPGLVPEGPGSEPAPPSPVPSPDSGADVPPDSPGIVTLTVLFEPNLTWPDMKAKLVLNRLSAKARVISTDPPIEKLEELETLTEFTIRLSAECDIDELHALADVDGVSEVRIATGPRPVAGAPPSREPTPEPARPVPVERRPGPAPRGRRNCPQRREGRRRRRTRRRQRPRRVRNGHE